MKKMSLKKKLLLAFLCTGLIPMFGIGLYLYKESSSALEDQAFAKLESIKGLKAKAVSNYFQLIKNQALTLAHQESTKNVFLDFRAGFNSYVRDHKYSSSELEEMNEKLKKYYEVDYAQEYEKQNKKPIKVDDLLKLEETQAALQASYIALNSNPLGSKHLLDAPDVKGSYNLTHAVHHPNFREYLEKFEFYDIFLIDGDSGNIIYTVFKEADFATSLKTGPYKDSGLARVFEKAMALTTETDVVMEDYSVYRPSYDGPAGFIAAPIWVAGEKKGVIAFQISFDKINTIMSEKSGDEKTLETFLVGSDFKMRSDSLLDNENRNVRASFRNPEKGSIETESVKAALAGTSGKYLRDNYLGNPVLISNGPVDVLGNKWMISSQWNQDEAFTAVNRMRISIPVFVICCAAVLVIFSIWFANKLAESLLRVTEGLRTEADTVGQTSVVVAEVSSRLSEATTEQAASLQETVASIDEISAMISRNADSAASSSRTSEQSTVVAQKGKDKVELMLESIESISSGNKEIIDQMQKSNKEISEIVKVIQEISQKTQVINDIVFQTKLLSFNASVEAARAGEHGKGFAVVAEEVGNLASMSGKAATEITDMLTKSVTRVTNIVEGTKGLMENLIRQSKEKVDLGTNTARECALALDEILTNVSSVNEMVREISTASQEQSSGVQEVNKAMSELDQVTQANSSVAQESSHTAGELKSQAERLNNLVEELTFLVLGQGAALKSKAADPGAKSGGTVVDISNHRKLPDLKSLKPKAKKKVVGVSVETPAADDPRFDEV